MPSTLTWLSHDTAERDRTLRLIELFKESGTVDELGIGPIRDTFSDAFFPGTSVLHTRARYLLFVPWLLEMTANESRNPDTAPEWLRDLEVRLIHALLAGGESEGVLGRDARAALKRMPSTVYDPALRRFRIRTAETTLDQFFRDAATAAERRRQLSVADDDALATRPTTPGLDPELAVSCPIPEGLLTATTFQLSPAEASYLRDRIVQATPGSLLAWLLTHEARAEAPYLWQHPDLSRFPADARDLADHARRFHQAIHGAALLYNLMLAKKKQSEDLVERYRARLAEWQEELAANDVWRDWSLPHFWQALDRHNPRLRTPTINFISDWINGARLTTNVAEDAGLRDVVANREQRLKGNRSRFVNAAALDNWSGGSGLIRLDYRWGITRRILADIFDGLGVAP